MLPKIRDFLHQHLKLELHPNKVSIKTLSSGVDFLGWVHFPRHRVLRTSTKRRMIRRVSRTDDKNVLLSYAGLISHGNARKLATPIRERLRKLEK